MTDLADVARRRIEREHAPLLDDLAAASDAVAAGWDADAVADAGAVTGPLRAELRSREVHGRLPTVLTDAVEATGRPLRAEPVAAPPYVTVTSRGPMLRGTLDDGRLVVTLGVFAVEQDRTARYVRHPPEDVAVDAEHVRRTDRR